MTLKGLWYLAHPYSGDHLKNFKKVNIIAAKLIKQGIMIYSPISHTHPIAYDGKLDPDDHDLWLKLDRQFMEYCVRDGNLALDVDLNIITSKIEINQFIILKNY